MAGPVSARRSRTVSRAAESAVPDAVVVTVGDELLVGETVDGNAAWLGRTLSELGFHVRRRYTVGDDDGDIRGAVARGLEEAEVVVVTGGLGPTDDDRTRAAVAGLLDAPLAIDETLLSALEARFRERGFPELPRRNVSQAQVPRGARVLPNPRGTAPGLVLASGGRLVALLPGVPAEMRAVAAGGLSEALRERFGDRLRRVHHRMLHTTGVAESELAGRIEDALPADRSEALGPVTVAYLPDLRGVDLRLTVRDAADADEAGRLLDRAEAALAPVLAPFRYGGDDLVDALTERLVSLGWTVALAESCTGGLLAKRITDRPGASRVFPGGVVAYDDAVKVEMLGVDPAVLAGRGAVSEEVARAMAAGARDRFGTRAAVAVTGVAGPGGGSDEKPVGTVWYAAALPDGVTAARDRFPGDREQVRERSAQAALALLYRALPGSPS